jgi:hypothetical protein
MAFDGQVQGAAGLSVLGQDGIRAVHGVLLVDRMLLPGSVILRRAGIKKPGIFRGRAIRVKHKHTTKGSWTL